MISKQVYILIGPKGSGKTFIGTLFKNYFNIDFIRVEDLILPMKKGRDIENEEYIRDAFQTIEKGVRKALNETDRLVFESTGLTKYFDDLLNSLKRDCLVTTIKVNADLSVCLKRIQARDQSIHINVSDEQVEKINTLVVLKNPKTDFEINNENETAEDLIIEIRGILNSIAPNNMHN